MKKVLIITENFRSGGTTSSLLALLENFDKNEFDIEIIVDRKDGPHLKRVESDYVIHEVNTIYREAYGLKKLVRKINIFKYELKKGILLYRIKSKIFKSKKSYKELNEKIIKNQNILEKSKYDYIISYQEGWPTYYGIKYDANISKIVWLHTDPKNSNLDMLDYKEMYRHYDICVCVDDECKKNLIELIPSIKNKTYVIRNMIQTNHINKLKNEKCDVIKDKKLNFITVARLDDKAKGISRAIEVCKKLILEGYDFRWYIVGDGRDRKEIERKIKDYKLEDKFILLGEQMNPYKFINKCDLFILPSIYEGRPISVEESHFLGVPTLVTNYASAFNQIEDGKSGIIVNNSFEGIKEGIEYIINNPFKIQEMKVFLKNNKKEYNVYGTIINNLLNKRNENNGYTKLQ